MRAVSLAFTNKLTSQMELKSPPSLPLKPIVIQPCAFAVVNALTTLGLVPPVLIPITTSSSVY